MAGKRVYPDDRDAFVRAMDKETLLDILGRNKSFIMTYRVLTENGPTYVTLKISRMTDDERFIVLGVTNTDDQVRRQKTAERAQEERIAYARLSALIGDFLCVFVVNPETDSYRQFSSTAGFKNYSRAGAVVIACGMSRFENDACVAPVFERADQSMYQNKNSLKAAGSETM